ncbi:tumor necrosis factor receptor superfamily member 1B isoform X1 [Takifugu rubripes]|uniref:tumor necrosis factor receptor superfamily member 1B isoform X1 n=1 Tax=Takifugu rubripes TaxID=31033 RepID=UPI0005D2A059|nr:tumor necrosis factor receptor superfamily member 14 isoform X1 [Takifugu rubripes]|eukprot:XP_011612295.1 PREDICTED: tumor necrosis factor receptor superfamily member 14 isoform X1 [Takifugu rubripes]
MLLIQRRPVRLLPPISPVHTAADSCAHSSFCEGAMKNTLLLLLLLNIQASEVRSLPYLADQNCLNPATEYKLDGSNLCCKKCQPGERLKEECSRNSETVCEPCPPGQYIESPNYSPNCFPCKKCKFSKGLQYIQNCSAQTMSKCGCRPNMFCQVGSKDCSSCVRYRSCNVGYGVSKPGMVNSDVRCEPCPEGTFSDKDSSTDPCQPHQSCQGRVIRAGNATANTVCKPRESFPVSAKVFATPTSASAATPAVVTPSVSPPAPEAFFNQPTKSPLPSSKSDNNLALIICIPVILLLLVSAIVLFCWSTVCRKGAGKCHPEVDANGNCGPAEKMKPGYFQETQLISLNMTSPEQECLLEKSEPSTSDHSHSSRSTDVLTRTENGSSSESIGPLHSTLPLHDLHSEESMNLLREVLPPQNSVHAQSSSQPATPQIISPVTTSPQVNVNITFHIGNSSGSTPKVSPTDLKVDPQLPFGAEEEALGILQQEAGKQFMTSVQESAG